MKYDVVCGGGELDLGKVAGVELGRRPYELEWCDEVRYGPSLFFVDDVDVCAEE